MKGSLPGHGSRRPARLVRTRRSWIRNQVGSWCKLWQGRLLRLHGLRRHQQFLRCRRARPTGWAALVRARLMLGIRANIRASRALCNRVSASGPCSMSASATGHEALTAIPVGFGCRIPDLPYRGAGPQVSPDMAGVLTGLIAVGHHWSPISLIRLALSPGK